MVSENTSLSGNRSAKSPDRRKVASQAEKVSFAMRSDIGCERECNEDRCINFTFGEVHGFFVFDGMGGELGGAAAAEISAEAIQAFYTHMPSRVGRAVLEQAIALAHSNVKKLRITSKMSSMGATVVGAILTDDQITFGAVGDSRAYRVSSRCVEQITHDHTVVQTMVDRGEITPGEALVHPYSHVLTSCLGSEEGFQIHSASFFIDRRSDQEGDYILLCSDGLYSLVSETEISEIIRGSAPQEATERFVALARERGGFDNITAIVIDLGGILCTEIPSDVIPDKNIDLVEGLIHGDEVARSATNKSSVPNRRVLLRAWIFLLVTGCCALLSMGAILFLRR